MSHDSNSLSGYEPIDSIEENAPLGHGVQQNFGADTRKTGKGKRASFWKGKGGRQYARRPDGRIITHDAEELGGDDASLADFSGVDSVVVEAPLGHGVTQYFAEGDVDDCPKCGGDSIQSNPGVTIGPSQRICSQCNYQWNTDWDYGADSSAATYVPSSNPDMVNEIQTEPTNSHFCSECGHVNGAEGDSPSPTFNEGITGQDGPNADPTNSNFTAQGYDDKQDESIGMRHRGRHSQSRKDRRDEASAMDRKGRMGRKYDDVATMDAEHNHWHNKKNGQFYGKWSKHRKNGQFSTHNSEYSQIMGPTVEANEGGLHSPSSFDISWEDGSGQSSASMPPNEIHFADTHDADFTLEKPVKTGFMVAFGAGLFSLAAVAGTVLVGNLLGGNE